jgi:two-component system nitrate/nitrite response regulator NarL
MARPVVIARSREGWWNVRPEAVKTNAVRVLIADDQPIFRHGLKKLLEADPALRVVGEATDGGDLVRLARALLPDVLLLDFTLQGTGGLDTVRELSTLSPPVRTLLLTAAAGKADIIEALQLGAHGVILKQSATDVLLKSIHTVMAGHYWIGRESVADLVETLRQVTAVGHSRKFSLTDRELEVISKVAAGYANREIAEEFSITEKTVKHHLTNIFDKLGVSSRLELALFALHHGLTPSARS